MCVCVNLGGGQRIETSVLWCWGLSGSPLRVPALLHLVGLAHRFQLGEHILERLLDALLQQVAFALTLGVLRVLHGLQSRAEVLQAGHVHRLTHRNTVQATSFIDPNKCRCPVASRQFQEVLSKSFQAKLVILTHISNQSLPTMQPVAAVARLTPENSP